MSSTFYLKRSDPIFDTNPDTMMTQNELYLRYLIQQVKQALHQAGIKKGL